MLGPFVLDACRACYSCRLCLCLQVSKISLVDLAGSERADSTGAKGTRLKVSVAQRWCQAPRPQVLLVLSPHTALETATL